MDKIIQNTIKKIEKIDITKEVDLFGNVAADILLKDNHTAVYIDNNRHFVELFMLPDLTNEKKQEIIIRFTELLAVLESLEKNKLVYVQNESLQGEYFFYQGKEYFEKDQLPDTFKVGNGLILRLQKDGDILMKDGKRIMTSTIITPQIGNPLARFFCSSIIPTESLKKFIIRGFKSEEERNTQLALRYSVISMTIAVLIAAVSPFFSVFVANRNGITTINQTQLDSLLNKAKPVFVVTLTDSLHNLNSQDNKIVLDNETTEKEVKNGK